MNIRFIIFMSEYLPLILEYEQRGLVTRTFRRLDPLRQQAIVSAVMDEAAEAGPADINIKKVAERAGVSVGSLYQYFGSRENLLDFAMELVVRSTVELFDSYRSMLAQMPLRDALTAYLSGGIEWSQQQQAVTRFFVSAAYQGNPRLAERVVRPIAAVLRGMVEEILQAAVQRGEVRADLDVSAAARVLNALLLVVGDVQLQPLLNQYFQIYDASMPVERVVDALFDLVEHGTHPGARI
jgi:TetR/AcrR family transcriptional regulator